MAIKSLHGACWFLLLPLPFNRYFYHRFTCDRTVFQLISSVQCTREDLIFLSSGSVYSRGFDIYSIFFSSVYLRRLGICFVPFDVYVRESSTNVGIDVKSMQFDNIVRKGNTIHMHICTSASFVQNTKIFEYHMHIYIYI